MAASFEPLFYCRDIYNLLKKYNPSNKSALNEIREHLFQDKNEPNILYILTGYTKDNKEFTKVGITHNNPNLRKHEFNFRNKLDIIPEKTKLYASVYINSGCLLASEYEKITKDLFKEKRLNHLYRFSTETFYESPKLMVDYLKSVLPPHLKFTFY